MLDKSNGDIAADGYKYKVKNFSCEGNFSAGIELLVSYCACQLITFCLISKYFLLKNSGIKI